MPRKKTDFEVQEKDTEKEYLDTIWVGNTRFDLTKRPKIY
jgi:hypothetical protein